MRYIKQQVQIDGCLSFRQIKYFCKCYQVTVLSEGFDKIIMSRLNSLNLKGHQYDELIDKFKQREEQTSLQEALVYLKLREFRCDNSKSLIFAKKKEKCIDGTISRDGPPGCRKLNVLKPEGKLINGWLRGQKHKYFGTTGYTDFLRKHESLEKRQITKYNQKNREMQEELRKGRSKSTVTINLMKPRESLDKIGAIKQDASKERENRNLFVEMGGLKLDQTTKNFFRDAQVLNEEGLIVRLGAFDHIIADKSLTLKMDAENMKGKSLSTAEVEGNKKRNNILNYQRKVSQYTDNEFKLGDEANKKKSWKKLIHTKKNDEKQLLFQGNNIEAASNPLILMNSKQLKKDLVQNQSRCFDNLTKYSSFYQNIEKAMRLQFLNNRKFSQSELGIAKTRKSENLQQEQ